MRAFLASVLLCAVVGVSFAADKPDPVEKQVKAISKAVGLSQAQTGKLKKFTNEYFSELDNMFGRFPDPRLRAPFTKAITARFRNKVREMMSPAQFARFESLERKS